MGKLTDKMQALKARSPRTSEAATRAAQLAGFARNAPRRHGADGTDRRSRRAEALLRLPLGASPALREFVSAEFDAGKDWSHAVLAAAAEGRRAAQDEPREPTLSAEEVRLCEVLGLSQEQYLSANAGR